MEEIGVVVHQYSNISVAIIDIKKGSLKVNDTIHVKGVTSDFTQKVNSIELEHKSVEEAKKG